MSDSSLIVCGLPESGKTSFLAALWHILNAGEIETSLTLDGLSFGDYQYVEAVRDRWLRGIKPARTRQDEETKVVGMDLSNAKKDKLQLMFPDHSGESYRDMWEHKICPEEVAAQIISRSGALLFINSNTIKKPVPLIDALELQSAFGEKVNVDEAGVLWDPKMSPTQVKIVNLLQELKGDSLFANDGKLSIFLSVWDKVIAQGLSPKEYLEARMPLLSQYLNNANHGWEIRVYGLSAQGADYISEDDAKDPSKVNADLLNQSASKRIGLYHDGKLSSDLTEPLSWMLNQ